MYRSLFIACASVCICVCGSMAKSIVAVVGLETSASNHMAVLSSFLESLAEAVPRCEECPKGTSHETIQLYPRFVGF